METPTPPWWRRNLPWLIPAVTALLVGLLLLADRLSGTDAAPATTAPATIPATTEPPATSSAAPTVPDTVEGGFTRETRLALTRCFDALHPFLAESTALGGPDLEEAQDACDEADLQLEVDGSTSGVVAYVAEANLVLAFAALRVTTDELDVDDLQADVDRLSRLIAQYL